MGVEKVRRRLAVRGPLTLGKQGDAGFERAAADVVKLRTGDSLGTPNIVGGTITSAVITGGTLNGQDGRVRIGTVATALGTTSTLPANVPGLVRVGVSGGTPQIGFVVNGTAYVLSASATGTGAVSMFANPAGS